MSRTMNCRARIYPGAHSINTGSRTQRLEEARMSRFRSRTALRALHHTAAGAGPIGRWRGDALEWPAPFFPIVKKDAGGCTHQYVRGKNPPATIRKRTRKLA